jgi:hypothetical protein
LCLVTIVVVLNAIQTGVQVISIQHSATKINWI